MKLPSSRWPAVLLMVLVLLGAGLLLLSYPLSPHRSQVAFDDIDCGPLPAHVPANFLQDVRQANAFPATLDTGAPELLARLHDAFRRHARVAEVTSVQVSLSRRIVVNLRFREPVALVQGERPWAVDALGVVLPPLPEAAAANLLPIDGAKDRPPVPGQVWSAVQPAAAVAATVRQDRDAWRLAAVVLGNDPLQPTVQLRTTGGSVVVWCDLRAPVQEKNAEKLSRLREYVMQYGSLDAPDGPYRFDVRHPSQGLLRQQIKP